MFVYELSGCGFESSCSHLNFRFGTCLEQGVPWSSGNYRVWILSEKRTWHDKNIQSIKCFISTSSGFLIRNWYFGSLEPLVHKSIWPIRLTLSWYFMKLINVFVFFWSKTYNYKHSVRMIWNIWSFFIMVFIVFICNIT